MPAGITCSVSGTAPNQTLGCGTFTLASGAHITVHLTSATTKDSCCIYSYSATFVSGNDGTDTKQASETVNCPSLPLTQSFPTRRSSDLSPIGFTVTLTNAGPGDSTGTTLS